MDFEFSDKVRALQQRVGKFMEDHVYPSEARFHEEVTENRRKGNAWVPTRIVEELKRKARAQDLWNLWLPESEFGAGPTNFTILNLEGEPTSIEIGRPVTAASDEIAGGGGSNRLPG